MGLDYKIINYWIILCMATIFTSLNTLGLMKGTYPFCSGTEYGLTRHRVTYGSNLGLEGFFFLLPFSVSQYLSEVLPIFSL